MINSIQETQKLGKEFYAVNEKKKTQILGFSKFPSAIKLSDLLSFQTYVEICL